MGNSSKEGKKQEPESESDPRVEAIVTVGWVSLAMLGISIPLTGLLAPVLSWVAAGLPVLIILGAGSMMAKIWFGDEQNGDGETKEELQARIADLEKRLSDLETIDSLESHFAERHRREEAQAVRKAETITGEPHDQISA